LAQARDCLDRLARAGLLEAERAVLVLDRGRTSLGRAERAGPDLSRAAGELGVDSLLLARPAEPYASVIDWLAGHSGQRIKPSDYETRALLKDLPVCSVISNESIVSSLRERPAAILSGQGVLAAGRTGPEEALVIFSSVCFVCLVKFLADCLAQRGGLEAGRRAVLDLALAGLEPLPQPAPVLERGPFGSAGRVEAALDQVGRLMVGHRLVYSFMGNVSYHWGDRLYISQRGSFLDRLAGRIAACPWAEPDCEGLEPSSELPAHRAIIRATGCRAVLHGHPKFSVVLSLVEPGAGVWFIEDAPVVTSLGPTGPVEDLSALLRDRPGIIIQGHGVFSWGREDFNEAWAGLLAVERTCRSLYLKRLEG